MEMVHARNARVARKAMNLNYLSDQRNTFAEMARLITFPSSHFLGISIAGAQSSCQSLWLPLLTNLGLVPAFSVGQSISEADTVAAPRYSSDVGPSLAPSELASDVRNLSEPLGLLYMVRSLQRFSDKERLSDKEVSVRQVLHSLLRAFSSHDRRALCYLSCGPWTLDSAAIMVTNAAAP